MEPEKEKTKFWNPITGVAAGFLLAATVLFGGQVYRAFKYEPPKVVMRDINEDGIQDICITYKSKDYRPQLYLGQKDGSFREVRGFGKESELLNRIE